jgi:hypothetical protein
MSLNGNSQMDLPAMGFNVRASISQEVGITSITIKYSRPGVKGREGKIWGNLVPHGFKTFNSITSTYTSPWRAGANEATVISFEHEVKVEGNTLKAGSYAIFMAMEPDSVTVIFSKQTEAWGSFYYKPEEDVLRVRVKSMLMSRSEEWLKYDFIEHKEKSCVIVMQWEKLSVPISVEVDVENIVLARVREQVTGVWGLMTVNLILAANYFYEQNSNLEEAVGWALKSVTGKPFGQTPFHSYNVLAIGYEKLNKIPQADSVMDVGLAVANINQYLDYGRKLISQNRKQRAMEIMTQAKSKFGNVYQVNSSLAYAYSAKGEYSQALKYANKALQQAPSPQAKATIRSNIEKLKAKKDIN